MITHIEMTPAARQTYHTQYLRWHRQQERIALRLVLVRLKGMAMRLSNILDSAGVAGVIGLMDMLVSEQDHRSMLEAIYTTVGPIAAQSQYDKLLPQKSHALQMQTKDRDVPPLAPLAPKPSGSIRISFFSQQWRSTMAELARNSETAQRISKMTEKTRQVVRDVLTQGASEAWDIRKIGRALRKVVVSKSRAMLIARTETTRAANVGHELGAMSTLLKLDKIWIATADSRTREDHLAMLRSKPVPRDGFFTVGGVNMRYPGDPAGGAAQCVNCRCVVSYIPSLNQN